MKATSLCMKAPKMWNELCNSVKLCSSVQEFKHKYKIFLLKKKKINCVCLSYSLAGTGMLCACL